MRECREYNLPRFGHWAGKEEGGTEKHNDQGNVGGSPSPRPRGGGGAKDPASSFVGGRTFTWLKVKQPKHREEERGFYKP